MSAELFFDRRRRNVEEILFSNEYDALLFTNELTSYWLGCGRTELVLYDMHRGWIYFDNEAIRDCLSEIAGRKGAVGFDSGLKAVELLFLDPDRRIQWISIGVHIASLMKIKDSLEIRALKLAAVNTRRAQLQALDVATAEMTEQDILNLIQSELSSSTSLIEWSFDPSVASGDRIKHAWPGVSGRKILANSPLLADVGTKVMGYCSDVSETVWVEPVLTDPRFKSFMAMREFCKELLEDMFSIEWTGRRVADLASWYKRRVEDSLFMSAPASVYLGHGLGLRHHEPPGVSSESNDLLQEGMVLSIEPWIRDKNGSNYRYELPVLLTSSHIESLEGLS